MLNDIKKEFAELDRTPRALRNFGLLFSGIFSIAAAVMVWKGSALWTAAAAAAGMALLAGLAFPRALLYPYVGWMTFALLVGSIMTRLVLAAVYFVVMTPIGLLLKLTGKDMLDRKIDKNANTYWKRHEAETDLKRYTRQF